MMSLVNRVKRKIRIQKIKRKAREPRQFTASMADIEAKLRHYNRKQAQNSSYDPEMIVHYHGE